VLLAPHPANHPRLVTSSGVLTPVARAAAAGKSSGLTASKPSSENCGARACPRRDAAERRLFSRSAGVGDGNSVLRGDDDDDDEGSGSTPPRCCMGMPRPREAG
jgi:hypothetical protein